MPRKRQDKEKNPLTGDEYVAQHAFLIRKLHIVVSYTLTCDSCKKEETMISDNQAISTVSSFVDKGWRGNKNKKLKHSVMCPECSGSSPITPIAHTPKEEPAPAVVEEA
jgi:hypothetical protein